jgi:beta-barrel assembly-enhancing protease
VRFGSNSFTPPLALSLSKGRFCCSPQLQLKNNASTSSARTVWGLALALAIATLTTPTHAETPPPVTAAYEPQDKDERGIWMQMEEEERKLKTSNFLIRDEGLNTYVRDVFCRTVGERCRDVRIYIVRTPYFNASMAPNGLMLVYSGLFLRTRDEAQMAAVLGHEFTHYERKHSLRLFRDIKGKTNAMGFLSMIPIASYGAAAAMTALQFGVIGSIFSFSRDMEREADTGSIGLLANGGYDLHAASRIWGQIRSEEDATAAARGKKSRKDQNGGMFASHPPTLERMTELAALAEKTTVTGAPDLGRDRYRAALAPFWASFIEDQIKLNDFGATDFLIQHLAAEGWTPELTYARGELHRVRGKPEDFAAAIGFYTQSIADPGAPVEAWRGLGLAHLRAGDKEKGQAALRTYLEKRPDAPDKAMMAMLAGVKG